MRFRFRSRRRIPSKYWFQPGFGFGRNWVDSFGFGLDEICADAFGGRILGQGEPKYLNSPDTPLFDKGRTLYNLDRAAPVGRKSSRMIVVEGYMDAIALAQAGYEDVVAPLGTALTEQQIEKLWSMVDTPVLCFDGDSAGQRAADRAMLRALPMLKPGHSLAVASLPVGVDPDELVKMKGSAAFQIILDTAQPLADRLWSYELGQGSTDTPERRAGLKQRLNDRVTEIADPLVKREYSKQVQDKFFEVFGWGWRKNEVKGVRRAIEATRAEATDSHIDIRSRIERQIYRGILLGVSRWPDTLYRHREQLQAIGMPTAHLADWRDILVSASYERPALEEDLIEAILASSDIQNIERRDLQHDLAFSFFFKNRDRHTAEADLGEVVSTLVVEQDLSARLAALETELYAPGLDDEAYGRKIDEHHGLQRELAQYRERLALMRADVETGLAAA